MTARPDRLRHGRYTVANERVDIRVGDCRERMREMPDQSVHCVVTSPPYFGLRDYGHADQIGLEPTPAEFVAALVEVFREVRRVLRDDGTLWLNLGDSYAATTKGAGGAGKQHTNLGSVMQDRSWRVPAGLKQKDLIGIPWRVAFALQDDGWYLRQDIIWHKPNPMPESVRDRCTKAHEYVFLLSKSARYWYDADAVAEPSTNRPPGNTMPTKNGRAHAEGDDFMRYSGNLHNIDARETRNRRSVWSITSLPYDGAHFATMPPALAEACILAGCPRNGFVFDPFGGAGTTGLAAARNGRMAVLIELNESYADLARRRIAEEWKERVHDEVASDFGPLFEGLNDNKGEDAA